MINPGFQPGQAYRVLRIIYYSMNIGLLVFLLAAVVINDMELPSFTGKADTLTLVNALLLVSIPAGYVLSGRKISTIREKDPFGKKFELFLSAMVLRWAMIEGVALLSIVGLIFLQDARQLIIFLLCIVVLSLNAPTREKVVRMARLNDKEAEALDES